MNADNFYKFTVALGIIAIIAGIISLIVILLISSTDVLRARLATGARQLPVQTSSKCDLALKGQLTLQTTTHRSGHFNEVVNHVRAHRPDCVEQGWRPIAIKASASGMCGETHLTRPDIVAGVRPPHSFLTGQGLLGGHPFHTTDRSDRDDRKNLFIHWKHSNRPQEGANCWLHLHRTNEWLAE